MKLINRLKDILANWSEEKKGLPKDIVEFAEEAMDDWKWCIDEDPDEIENMGSVKDFLEMYDSAKPKKEPKKPEPPKNESKPAKEPKADKPKNEKKPAKDKKDKEPKQPKVSKEAFAEKPYWYFILDSYVSSYAGKNNKQQWRVRQFVKFINCTCNADLHQTTPHIDLIRKIRKELVNAGNSSDKNVDIPNNSSLVADCKEAIKKYSISKKLQKEAIKEIALSGL